MEEEKYYFITYEWIRDGLASWEKSNAVVTVHPVIWLKSMITEFKDRYRILFWQEITQDQYEAIDGWID